MLEIPRNTLAKSKTLADEIISSERRLLLLDPRLHEALVPVVINSASLRALFIECDTAWVRLKSRCVLFNETSQALAGYMPESLRLTFLAEEPAQKDVSYFDGERMIEYRWDRELVAEWQAALAELQINPDAALPDSA